jgi:hypothetical protein
MYNARKMHKPRDMWRSREYAFVDFLTQEEAARAISLLGGISWPGLAKDSNGIVVQYARTTE